MRAHPLIAFDIILKIRLEKTRERSIPARVLAGCWLCPRDAIALRTVRQHLLKYLPRFRVGFVI